MLAKRWEGLRRLFDRFDTIDEFELQFCEKIANNRDMFAQHCANIGISFPPEAISSTPSLQPGEIPGLWLTERMRPRIPAGLWIVERPSMPMPMQQIRGQYVPFQAHLLDTFWPTCRKVGNMSRKEPADR